MPSLDYYFEFLQKINELKCKILGVCGDHFLMVSYYHYNNIKIKFETDINYCAKKSRQYKNIYIANF